MLGTADVSILFWVNNLSNSGPVTEEKEVMPGPWRGARPRSEVVMFDERLGQKYISIDPGDVTRVCMCVWKYRC